MYQIHEGLNQICFVELFLCSLNFSSQNISQPLSVSVLQTCSNVLPQAYSRLLRWNWRTFSSNSLNWIPDSWRKFFFTSCTFSVETKCNYLHTRYMRSWQLLGRLFINHKVAHPGSVTCPSSILTPRPGWRWSGSPCVCQWLGRWPAPLLGRGHISHPTCASWCPSAAGEYKVKLGIMIKLESMSQAFFIKKISQHASASGKNDEGCLTYQVKCETDLQCKLKSLPAHTLRRWGCLHSRWRFELLAQQWRPERYHPRPDLQSDPLPPAPQPETNQN